ncbi:MAG TPA: FAD-binding protein, partial [Nitrospirae bacterium]|nr:FAD-binding protein [Nitrospirota bacterium]
LFAAGEVACTGVHGANRLASNSLLEGLVFGARTGRSAVRYAAGIMSEDKPQVTDQKISGIGSFDLKEIRSSLRRLMWGKAGIIRCGESLSAAKEKLKEWDVMLKADFFNTEELELKNMLTGANLITDAALLREGSIGAHYRSDFTVRGENWHRHTLSHRDKGTIWINREEDKKICAK